MVGIVRRVIEVVITSSTRNRVASEIARGFESLTLRQKASLQAVLRRLQAGIFCTSNHHRLLIRFTKLLLYTYFIFSALLLFPIHVLLLLLTVFIVSKNNEICQCAIIHNKANEALLFTGFEFCFSLPFLRQWAIIFIKIVIKSFFLRVLG